MSLARHLRKTFGHSFFFFICWISYQSNPIISIHVEPFDQMGNQSPSQRSMRSGIKYARSSKDLLLWDQAQKQKQLKTKPDKTQCEKSSITQTNQECAESHKLWWFAIGNGSVWQTTRKSQVIETEWHNHSNTPQKIEENLTNEPNSRNSSEYWPRVNWVDPDDMFCHKASHSIPGRHESWNPHIRSKRKSDVCQICKLRMALRVSWCCQRFEMVKPGAIVLLNVRGEMYK